MNRPRALSCSVSILALILASAYPRVAAANPQNGNVSAGNASITSSGSTLTINQTSDKAIIDWRGFDIANGETTRFVQPSSGSLTLNRVNSVSQSVIDGTLAANGNIVIVNPNGVLFGKNAQVNVNSLIATTADIDNSKFMAGSLAFTKPGSPNATIENQGTITAQQAGLVGLVAPRVLNSGVINAKLGRIHLASGDTATVDLYGDGLMEVQASPALQQQLVDNTGTLNAQGGTIALTAAAAGETVNSLIHAGGTLDATAVSTQNGTIYIYAEGSNAVPNNFSADKGIKTGASAVTVDGNLDVSSAVASGGTIKVLGDKVTIAKTATIKADGAKGGGTIDVGGEFHGAGLTPTALTTLIEDGAFVSANATVDGNGGNVAVWSDQFTSFYGTIQAKGAGSGNGGFVETSSHKTLLAFGLVNASAAFGKAGQWLLDPADITITASTTTNNTTTTPYAATGTGSQVSAANIKTNLDAGTNVTVTTSNDGYAGNGDIIVSSAISTTGAGSLTLSAYRNVAVEAPITLHGGALTLHSDNTGIGSGLVYISAAVDTSAGGGGAITIGGGSGTITAGSGFAVGNASDSSGVDIVGTGSLNSGNGNMIINGTGWTNAGSGSYGVNVTGPVTSANGNITITTGYKSGADAIVGSINTSSLISTTGTGNVTLSTYRDIIVNGGITTSGGGSVTLRSDNGGNSAGVVYIGSAINTSTGGGAITIGGGSGAITAGSGFAVGDSADARGVRIAGGSLNSGNGNIIINGQGWAATSSNNYGVYLNGTVTAANGNITINGTGGGSGSGSAVNVGIWIANALKTTGTGNITLVGIGGSSTGGTNYGIYTPGGTSTTGGGTITIKGIAGGGGNSYGIGTDNTNQIYTTGGGNIVAYSDTFTMNTGGVNISSSGSLTIAPYSNTTMGVGDGGTGTLHLSDGYLNALSAASYIFGSTTTATGGANTNLLTVGTGHNFGDSNLTFISGGSINLNGYTLTKASGTATVNYLFQANSDIYNTSGAGVAANSGKINITFQSNAAGSGSGAVYFLGGTFTTSGGNITIGGGSGTITAGSGYAIGDSTYGNGVKLDSVSFNTGSGNIIINGQGWGSAACFNNCLGVAFVSSILNAAGNGSITVNGIGGGSGGSQYDGGVSINNTSLATVNGNINLTGHVTETGGGGTGVSFYNAATPLTTTGTGNINMTDTGTLGGGFGAYVNTNTVSAGGNITYTGNLMDPNGTYWTWTAGGTITIAPYTAGTSMGIGTGAGTLKVTDTMLSNMTAASFVFGSTGAGGMTVTSAHNFGDSNLQFISGGTINLSHTLIKSSGTGTANYVFDAYNDIGIFTSITASSGKINLTLQSNYNNGGSGGIDITAPITTNGGNVTIGGGSGTITAGSGYAINYGGQGYGVMVNGTINAGSGNIIINGQGSNNPNTSTDNNGVDFYSGTTSTTGNGTITITGIAGATANIGSGTGSIGVYVYSSTISTTNNTLTITGTGGGASFNGGNYGVQADLSGVIQSTGSGNVIITGTGGSDGGGTGNDGVMVNAASSGVIQTTGSGSVTLYGIAGAGSSNGVNTYFSNSLKTTGTGNITIYANSLNLGNANSINSIGSLTIAPYTNTSMGVGTSAAGTLHLTDGALNDLTAASYIFGSPTTGTGGSNTSLLTVQTGHDFAGTNVTFVSGGNINLAGTLTKATGAGTANYVFDAYGNIGIASNITASSGQINLTLQSNYNNGGAGDINITAPITTNGGNITIGGGSGTITAGSGYAIGSGTSGGTQYGVAIFAAVTSGAGNIVINGKGVNDSGGGDYGVYVNSTGSITTTSGNVTINGIGGDGSGIINAGVVSTGSVQTGSGNLTVTGTGGSGTNSYDIGIWAQATGAFQTTGGGTLTIKGIGGSYGSQQGAFSDFGLYTEAHPNEIETTNSGNIVVYTDTISLRNANTFNSAGNLTIAPYTNTSMGVGTSAAGTLQLTDGALSDLTAASYIFGSATTGTGGSNTSLLTVQTGHDFAGTNVTFVSGGNINLAGTLTKATGAGTANYAFDAYGDITNSNSAGVSATTGQINLTLQSNYSGSGAGAISFAGGTISSGGGNITMGGGSGTITAGSGYAIGDGTYSDGIRLATTTVNAGGGAIIMNGHGYAGSPASGSVSGIYSSGTVSATGSGTITLNGIGGSDDPDGYIGNGISGLGVISTMNGALSVTGTGNGTGGIGVYANHLNAFETTGSGNLTITGTGSAIGGLSHGIYSTIAGGIETTGSGNLILKGVALSAAASYGLYADAANEYKTTGTGNITLYTDTISLNAANAINSAGTLTIAPYSNISMGIGTSAAGTLDLSDTALNDLTAASYIFGSRTTATGAANTGLLTINTAHDFGNRNLSFISGGDINIAANLITIVGADPTWLFQADGNITNSNNASLSQSSYNNVNVTLDSGHSGGGGTTTWNGGSIATGGGTLTFTHGLVIGANGGNFNTTDYYDGIYAGTINFNSTVNGSGNILATGSSLNLSSAWGGTTPLGSVSLHAANAIALPSITASTIQVETVNSGLTGNITINSGSVLTASGSGDAVVLATAGNITNSAGSGAINLTGSGRWVIALGSGGTNTYGNLNSNNTAIWNWNGLSVPSPSQTGNRYVFTTAKIVTFTSTNDSKTYGTDVTSAVASDYTISGLDTGVSGVYNADTNATAFTGTPTVTSTGSAATAHVAGSPYVITVSSSGLTGLDGYSIAVSSSGHLTVNPKTVTLSASKTYDGTTSLTGDVTIGGLIGAQTLNYTGATSNDANVATANKYINAITLTNGTGTASDYQLPTLNVGNAPVTITPATVTLSASKVYNGNTSLTGDVTIGGLFGSQTLTYSGATSNDANVATANKYINAITLADGTNGGLASNYQLPTLNNANAPVTISAKTVTLSASKTYDGTTSLTGDVIIGGFIGSETLTYSGATSNDAHVATAGKYINAITLADGTNGGLASNYALPTLNNTNAPVTINTKTVTLSASKTYDGTTSLTGDVTIGGLIGSETLNYTGATSNDANVATANKYINAITLANGTGTASDYALPTLNVSNAPVTITPATVTLSASKTYDGTTSLTGDVTIGGLFGSQTLAYSGATSNDAHVSTAGKYINTITLADGTNGGFASNYALPTLNNTNAPVTITPATLTGSITANNKIYDGVTAATVASATLNGTFYGSDASHVALTYTAATFNSKDVATATTVTATGLGLSGTAASDYQLSSNSASVSASVTPKTLQISTNNITITYGASVPTGTISYSGFATGESATSLTTAPTVNSSHSGIVDVGTYNGNYTVSGAVDTNYSFVYAGSNLTVAKRALTVTTNDQNIKSGDPLPTFTGSNNLIAQDASQITWHYTPTGYNGTAGSYVIAATATDPANRLANYNVSYADGTFTVTNAVTNTVVIPSTVLVNIDPLATTFSAALPLNTPLSGTNSGVNNNGLVFVYAAAPKSVGKLGSGLDISMAPSLQQQLGYTQVFENNY